MNHLENVLAELGLGDKILCGKELSVSCDDYGFYFKSQIKGISLCFMVKGIIVSVGETIVFAYPKTPLVVEYVQISKKEKSYIKFTGMEVVNISSWTIL